MLHVGDIDGSTRRSKIQPYLDVVMPLFWQYFTPRKAVAVDEAMITYKGRVSFRQYVRGKPHPWDIKAYALEESASGYLYSLVIYYGKETTSSLAMPQPHHSSSVDSHPATLQPRIRCVYRSVLHKPLTCSRAGESGHYIDWNSG